MGRERRGIISFGNGLVASAFVALSMIAIPQKAVADHGGFVVCNESGTMLYMSIAYRDGLSILFDKWNVGGRWILEQGKCMDLFRPISNKLQMYVAFREKGWFGSFSDYQASLRSNNRFAYPSDQKMCIKDEKFEYSDTLSGIGICLPGYEPITASGFIDADAIPIGQHYNNILYVE